jgi:regulatory protein
VSETSPGTIALSAPRGTSRLRCVSLDGIEIRRTSVEALRLAAMDDGDNITEAEAHRLIDEAEPEAAMNRALRLLGHRERSTAELESRLSDDGYPESVIGPVLSRLADYGYLDDARFAEGYTRAKRSAGWGRPRISRGLAEKGIEPELAATTLDAHAPDTDEADRALAAIAALDLSTRRDVAKALRRLVSRGYSYETARAAVDRAREQPTEQGDRL